MLGKRVIAGMQQVFQTRHPVVIYAGSGTGAWEAALSQPMSPGDAVLMFETGQFASLWQRIAVRLGLEPEFLSVPGIDPATGCRWSWRKPAQPELIEARLRQDRDHAIQRGLRRPQRDLDRRDLRHRRGAKAIDAAGHPALLLVDTISGLACADYRHDEWGVDVAIGRLAEGADAAARHLASTRSRRKAIEASKAAKCRKAYWAWDEIVEMNKGGYWPSRRTPTCSTRCRRRST